MGDTSIEWCRRPRADGTLMPGYSFNGWWGCEKVSPACKECYAEAFSHRLGLDLWNGHTRRFFGDAHWAEPLKWNRKAAKHGEQHLVFAYSMADYAETPNDRELRARLDAERLKLWRLIDQTPSLIWLLLTKRPENTMELVPPSWRDGFPPNVWALTTTENQEELDRRAPHLLEIPAVVHGVSAEPLLGRVDFTEYLHDSTCLYGGAPAYRVRGGVCSCSEPREARLDWLIVGGESGRRPRDFVINDARSIVQQGHLAGAAVLVKQLGDKPVEREGGGLVRLRVGKAKGGDLADFPPDLRVRQWPDAARLPARSPEGTDRP